MELKELINSRRVIFWDVKDPENLPPEVVTERILNYGDFEDFKELVRLLGINKVAAIFRKQIEKPRNNYLPEVKNYFNLYFDKYAKADSK